MTFSALRKRLFRSMLTQLLIATFLAACGGADKPFTLVDPSANPGGTPPGGGSPPPGGNDCIVNFNGTMQLKVDSTNTVKLNANPVTIDPIPIKVNGNELTMEGDSFPDILLTTLSPQADLSVNGAISGNKGTGTYDPATGKIEIAGFKFLIKVFAKGTTNEIADPVSNFPAVTFTTDPITATGNHDPIEEAGQALNKTDRTLKLVAGMTIPAAAGVLSNAIGGGALTATLTGTLDQLPENCTAGGGTPGGGGNPGTSGPSEFSITDGSAANVGSIDFGSTLVLVTTAGGDTILDCSEASNRGALSKLITITNKAEGERKLKIGQPADTDPDTKDPLCSGGSEFVRGSISVTGGASCETVTVAGKQFLTGDCTIPAGNPEAKITFPLMYVPYNFTAPVGGAVPEATPAATPSATPGATPAPAGPGDTGSLVIQYDDGKTFALGLKGKAEPDSRDSLAISKVKNGVPSKKLIRNRGLVKFSLKDTDPKPFTQEFVVKNTSGDTWQNLVITVEDSEAFTVTGPAAPTVGPGTVDAPGTTGFSIAYNPSASGTVDQGKLIIHLNKVGSTAQTELTFDLQGAVGVDPILGTYKLKIDFLVAFIDNALQTKPVESLDFREFPAEAPQPQTLEFGELNEEEIQLTDIIPIDFDPLSSTVAQRRTALRIFNAQGSGLVPGDQSSMCHEPDPINVAYKTGDCAFFYFNIGISENSQGVYDEETGNMTIPNLKLRIQNPYHGNVGGVWPPSNPGLGSPADNILDTVLDLSLTTQILDKKEDGDLVLVPDPRISRSDLSVASKADRLGDPCPDDPALHPHMKCYLTSDGKFIQGKPLSLRPGSQDVYDVVVVGVGQYKPRSVEPDTPVFMDNSRMYLAIQGRLCKDGTAGCN